VFAAPPPGPPGGLAVNVQNTPLPVTGSLAISGTPTVTISGTPAVTVSGTPNVQITNPAASPVLVQDVLKLTRTPFQASGTCSMTGIEGACEVKFMVPASKLLVIETVSLDINMQPGQKADALMVAQLGGKLARYFFLPQLQLSANGLDFFTVLQTVRVYADPGTTVSIFGERNAAGGDAGTEAAISGYLVDCSTAGSCNLP